MDAVIFGQALHPDLFDKAATLMYKIIVGHVFHDGNKRTGLASAQLLIMRNGYDLPLYQISAEAVTVAEKVATRQLNVDELTEWLRKRSVPL
ncbi:MAG: type II toxin-antitoxin system death-on-curing family toxin [Anaerolineae bacterium]|nr:type II toxin-antitoxin system death-on-curing family toxin [Anaerolineae bacterium]